MALWVRGFVVTDVALVHREFEKIIADAERLVAMEKRSGQSLGGVRLVKTLNDTYDTFNANLKLVATRGAQRATKGMVERLHGNRQRPPTGSIPPLEDLAVAMPLAPIGKYQTGAVGVGNVDFLNRAINPHSRGYGSYWRAIEYGTGQGGVPSQLGRILYGSFVDAGGGNPTRPMSQYAGGGGPHPAFISGGVGTWMQDGVRTVGMGTINREVPAKHFIQFGADDAAVAWRADLANAQQRAISELRAIRLSAS